MGIFHGLQKLICGPLLVYSKIQLKGGQNRLPRIRHSGFLSAAMEPGIVNARSVIMDSGLAAGRCRRSRWSRCRSRDVVGWVEPPGPAFGRPDGKLRETHHQPRRAQAASSNMTAVGATLIGVRLSLADSPPPCGGGSGWGVVPWGAGVPTGSTPTPGPSHADFPFA